LSENRAGEILAQMQLVGDGPICGTLTAMTPASASAAGSITLQGNRQRIISVRPGTLLAGAQIGADACFTYGFKTVDELRITRPNAAFVSS